MDQELLGNDCLQKNPFGFQLVAEEMARMEQVENARKEQNKISGEAEQGTITQKMFRVV